MSLNLGLEVDYIGREGWVVDTAKPRAGAG